MSRRYLDGATARGPSGKENCGCRGLAAVGANARLKPALGNAAVGQMRRPCQWKNRRHGRVKINSKQRKVHVANAVRNRRWGNRVASGSAEPGRGRGPCLAGAGANEPAVPNAVLKTGPVVDQPKAKILQAGKQGQALSTLGQS